MKILLILSTILLSMALGKKMTGKVLSPAEFAALVAAMKVKMEAAFNTSEIIPDVIDQYPDHALKVKYCTTVNLGNIVDPALVKKQPTSIKWMVKPSKFYTLAMIDPDVPSRKEHPLREWHHWLVGNIPGTKITKGEILSGYIGSAPPKDTGLHRYTFLVFEQPGNLTFDEPRLANTSTEHRENFSIKKFAEKYKLGSPIAGNFFQAEQT